MFTPTSAFSGFSVDDIAAAKAFYGDTLGLDMADDEMGSIRMSLPGGGSVFVYAKDDHQPASFTVLNFVADNVEAAVDELNGAGVVTKIYDDSGDDAGFHTDEKGIARGHGMEIAWFKDPAGNILAVLSG
ncbi:MAG: VOC family protein [Rhodoglobus sp.]